MATFKVGQRVRVVKTVWPNIMGKEGTIRVIDGGFFPYGVAVDGMHSGGTDGLWWGNSDDIEPLTDPKAEEFIERVKKLAREPAPMRETETL